MQSNSGVDDEAEERIGLAVDDLSAAEGEPAGVGGVQYTSCTVYRRRA